MLAVFPDVDEQDLAAQSTDPFELGGLLRRCMNDRSLAAQLVTAFTSRLVGIVNGIEHSLANQNWSLAAAKVHELKGEAGSLAAIELQIRAGVLEACLRTQDAHEAPAYFLPLKLAAEECICAGSAVVERLRR